MTDLTDDKAKSWFETNAARLNVAMHFGQIDYLKSADGIRMMKEANEIIAVINAKKDRRCNPRIGRAFGLFYLRLQALNGIKLLKAFPSGWDAIQRTIAINATLRRSTHGRTLGEQAVMHKLNEISDAISRHDAKVAEDHHLQNDMLDDIDREVYDDPEHVLADDDHAKSHHDVQQKSCKKRAFEYARRLIEEKSKSVRQAALGAYYNFEDDKYFPCMDKDSFRREFARWYKTHKVHTVNPFGEAVIAASSMPQTGLT